ncbi:5'-nucleotidase C-terminal domain-containing protein [Paenibacillus allorhizosphaerae]|uniref:SLH domain-containing protein n=1 Tax=Paenibacillus allorhizosphaerae TaxID=2849866 RepID=A0ABM8VFQ7_9BACL|nr:5'-nucleotidase C-terminal domain-containing protein [Paenibacillus allorhizosphaerae]CAG7635859.1 hypothetical protein PAECIP111802_02188 [Paenibacillus allorhizosphaerae]
MKKRWISTVAAGTLLFGLLSPLAHAEEAGAVHVQLLGMNDLHGKIDQEYKDMINGVMDVKIGRIDYAAALLKARKAQEKNTIIMHSGDMVGGSPPLSALLQDEPTVEVMQNIGFAVGTLGNHEFDEGVPELMRMIKGGDHPKGTKGFKGMGFPLVAANVIDESTGKPLLDPYTIIETGGVKIAFIGVVTRSVPGIVVAGATNGVKFTDESEAINTYVPEIRAKGVEAIVVLAHVAGEQKEDTVTGEIADIAKKTDPAVDVIYAAHNHVKLNGLVNDKLIVQAWEYSKAFVDIDLDIDRKTGDIVKKSAQIVDVVQADVQPDPEVAAILKKYGDQVRVKLEEVVGKAAVAMPGGYGVKGATGDNALGNLIADGMRYEMNSDFALMNGGGIRDNLSEGDITWGEAFNIQPFGNTLVKVNVTGAQFEEILNNQITQKYGPDYSVGGFSYTWNGLTNKVVDIIPADGTKFDKNKEYTVVVNNFMYGQTGAKGLLNKYGKNVVNGPEDLEGTLNYIKSFKEPIKYAAEKRISQKTFADTQGHWANAEIEELIGKSVVNGKSDKAFSPDEAVTRAELAKMVVSALELKSDDKNLLPFDDLTPAAWYYDFVRTAYNQKLMDGEGGSFAPDSEVTGETALAMVLSALKTGDADKEAVTAKLSAGLEGGDASKQWNAAEPVGRAQAAVLLSRMLALKAAQKK